METVSEREPELIDSHIYVARQVPNQPGQDILVGEGGALVQDCPILQRVRGSGPPE